MTREEMRVATYAIAYGAGPRRIHQLINRIGINSMPSTINHTDLLDLMDDDDIMNYLDEQDVANHFGLYTDQENEDSVSVALATQEGLIESLESRVQELQEQVNQYEQGGLH